MKEIKWKKKQLAIPVIQGGMGVGISLGGLAGAVAKEGGMGVISTAQIGFQEPDFYDDPMTANLSAIPKEISRAKEIANGKGLIACNIMVALNGYEQSVRAAVRGGVDAIISGAGLPAELPGYVAGSDVLIAPIVSSQKSAAVLLKLWHRKFKRTADFVVIEGPKAGGHLGFSLEDMKAYEKGLYESFYEEEVKEIISVVRGYGELYGQHIPVFLAGGMEHHQDLLHAKALGADGIQVATRFVTTKECDAHMAFKQAYIGSQREDIAIVKSPVGMPGRAIVNPFMEEVQKGKKFPPKRCLHCLKKCNPAEIPYCISERLILSALGQVEQGLLFCGAGAYKETEITSVKEVIKSLLEQ